MTSTSHDRACPKCGAGIGEVCKGTASFLSHWERIKFKGNVNNTPTDLSPRDEEPGYGHGV